MGSFKLARSLVRSGLIIVGVASLALASTVAAQAVDPHAAPAPADSYRDKTTISPEALAKGEGVYDQVCAACHNTGVNRAPSRMILGQMTPDSIHRVLTEGIMKAQAAGLSADQKVAVAEYLAKRHIGAGAGAPPLMCAGKAAQFDRGEPPPLEGWGFDDASTHAIPTAVAGLDKANVGRLKLKWSVAFPSALRARSQPALAGGALFVGSHDGTVYALDRASGCARWTFKAAGEVRTGIVVAPWAAGDAAAKPLAYFGDILGNLYAVDAFTGVQMWRTHMDRHPSTTVTAAPALYKGKLYVPVSSLEEGASTDPKYECCTFRGSVAAVDAATGQELWRTWLSPVPKARRANNAGAMQWGPSGVAVWSSPAIDVKRGQLYVTTGDNYSTPATDLSDAIVAMDLGTGKIRWAYQAQPNDAWNGSCSRHDRANCPEEDGPDFDFGAGAVLATGHDGHDYVLAGQKSGIAYGVHADTGKLAWKQQVGRGGVVGGIHFGLAAVDGRVFVPVSDVPDGKTYDHPARPGLYALDVATGKYAWQAPSADVCAGKALCHPGYSGAITATPELVFAGSNDGFLRVYDAKAGGVVWETNTVREFTTVNGTTAQGGSMGGGAAPIAYHGMLFMPSGYGFAGKMPGNVLLAFGVE